MVQIQSMQIGICNFPYIFKLLSCWNYLCGAPRYATMSSNLLSSACKWIAPQKWLQSFSLYIPSVSTVWEHTIYTYILTPRNQPFCHDSVKRTFHAPFRVFLLHARCSSSLQRADGRHGGGKIHKSRAPDVLVYLWNSQHFVVRSQLPRPSAN